MAGYDIQIADTVAAASLEQIYRAAGPYAADGEASDAYVITVVPAVDTLVAGMVFHFKANTANTGACTLNVNAKGAKAIKKNYNVDLDDNDIKANQLVSVIYDGTNFQLLSPINTANIGTTYKNGVTTRAGDTASGTQNIAHGLGVAPVYVRITCTKSQSSTVLSSNGVYNGTTNSCVYWLQIVGGSITGNSSTQGVYMIDSAGNSQVAVITVDATNIILTWTKAGTPHANNINILWEAFLTTN